MTQLMRVRDWRGKLAAAIEARRRVPFSDEANCALFMADAVRAMTGVDLAASFRGQFKTIAEGEALLQQAGYADLAAYLAAHLIEIAPPFARAGDLMLIWLDGLGWAGGVVNGETVTVVGLKGLASVSRLDGKRAFKVG